MEMEDSLRRLQILQRDLAAFTQNRIPNVERLATQLDASTDDLRRLLARNKRNQKSRDAILPNVIPQPTTIQIENVEYRVQEQFRQDAITVADELDLDELEAAKLCVESPPVDVSIADTTQALRALLRYHDRRQAVLECFRLLLQLSLDTYEHDGPEYDESHDERTDAFKRVVRGIIEGTSGGLAERSAFWRKCLDGLSDIELYMHKNAEQKQKIIMTGQALSEPLVETLHAQRISLTRQHESLTSILTHLIELEGSFVQIDDFRAFLIKAAGTETDVDISFHYIPVLIVGAKHFTDPRNDAPIRDLHALFADGPGQLQWKQANLKSAVLILWLAEYSQRFSSGTADLAQTEAERKKAEESRLSLFDGAIKDQGFHYLLSAASFFRPIVWYDPARAGITDYLVDLAPAIPAVAIPMDVPRASDEFAILVLRSLQSFASAFVDNMPDALRTLRADEDEKRRDFLSQSATAPENFDMSLERFMVITACAFHDDSHAAQDFWADKEGNLYGFLRWISQRLPTPRVAAFCQLLRSIACDQASADKAHHFLLEETSMASTKLRKGYSVSWSQIFNELELYSSSLKSKLTTLQKLAVQPPEGVESDLAEPETGIMLDAYLGLAAHICRASPLARNWLLTHQSFHIGKTIIDLVKTDVNSRIKACCLDMLSALLTDKVLEVRNGLWVLLDTWISGPYEESQVSRPSVRQRYSAKQYLDLFGENPEAAAALIGLLNALVSPSPSLSEVVLDMLPFPEHLGAPDRHAGIDEYVDFVMHTVFAQKVTRMQTQGEGIMIDLLRHACLEFTYFCLSSFNENLVILANTANAGIESAMETKSLAIYVKLHPFARVMEWLFDKAVIQSLFATIQRSSDDLNMAHPASPLVQSTVKALQVLNLAWKLQPTYFNIVKKLVVVPGGRRQRTTLAVASSVDEIFLSSLSAISDVAKYASSFHTELVFESLLLLQRIGSSRRLAENGDTGVERMHRGNRVISVLTHLGTSLTLELAPAFMIEPWDLEDKKVLAPPKLTKAKTILDLLQASLKSANGKPSMAHCLLGFNCYERFLDVAPNSPFASGSSLFHAIAICAADSPIGIEDSNISWLLAVKRGCLDIILSLLSSPLTTRIVRPELRTMEFCAALAKNQTLAMELSHWDGKPLQEPLLLLDSSADAVRDFMHIREIYFELYASDLRNAAEQASFSIQERLMSALLGTVKLPAGEQAPVVSIFDLLDFFELETRPAPEIDRGQLIFLADVDLSTCIKDDHETLYSYDIEMAQELLLLVKKELTEKGTVTDTQRVNDECCAILASLVTQNKWAAIQFARLEALEAWTDLTSLMVTKGGLPATDVIRLSLQGLLTILSRFEKSLTEDMEAAALLAKVALTFTQAIGPASLNSSQQTASVATERLHSVYRVALKAMTDSSGSLALRDCCYRICCAVLSFQQSPSNATSGRSTTIGGPRQLLRMTQNCGERLLTTVTEDAFSGRGVTRVSALLYLDSLLDLFRTANATSSMLRELIRQNFLPVLLDSSINAMISAFRGEVEMQTTMAYFHTAFALLLKLCQTTEGIQLVLSSGFFESIEDSKIFGTDVDNDTLSTLYRIMASVLRVITAIVIGKGAQPVTNFLISYRASAVSVFKLASKGDKNIVEVSEEWARLFLVADFLDFDEPTLNAGFTNGYS